MKTENSQEERRCRSGVEAEWVYMLNVVMGKGEKGKLKIHLCVIF